MRAGTHGLAHDVVLFELVGCLPQGCWQRVVVCQFLAGQAVGVALFHAFAWIQFAADAVDTSGQDSGCGQVWAGATVNTAVFNASTVWDPQHVGAVVAAVHGVGWCPSGAGGRVWHADTLIRVDVRPDQCLHTPGVFEHAGNEVIGGLGQPEAIVFIVEDVVAVLVP